MLPGAAPFLSTGQAEGFLARAYDCHIIGCRHLSQGLGHPAQRLSDVAEQGKRATNKPLVARFDDVMVLTSPVYTFEPLNDVLDAT